MATRRVTFADIAAIVGIGVLYRVQSQALIISTALLVALGFAEPAWTLAAACALMVAAALVATRK